MIKRPLDTVYTFRFIRILVQNWNKTEAFKLGLIDGTGTKLRSPSTNEEKEAYTFFHRVVFNIKRLIEKSPVGKRLISFAVAYKLLKEATGIEDDNDLISMVEESLDIVFDRTLSESSEFDITEGNTYRLTVDYPTKYVDLPSGSLVEATGNTQLFAGVQLHEAKHLLTDETIYITENEVAISHSVSTGDVANIPKPLMMPNGDTYQKFTVPASLFNKINTGRGRYQRWNKFMDMNDDTQCSICQFAKKYRNASIMIEDEVTGATRVLKPISLGEFQT